jgi:hypothetical protein
MAVDAAGIGSAAAGIVFLYAGVKGISALAALQSIVRGQSPLKLPVANPVSGTPATAAAGPVTSGMTSAPVNDPQFAAAVLSGIGAPATGANVRSIESWIGREGGGGANNPLNTTYPLGGATSFNSVGVKNYPSAQDGIQATVDTLNGGGYQDIILLLRSGNGLCGHTLAGLSTWSGGGYSSVC